jgi:DNA-binding NtrC family response regulator
MFGLNVVLLCDRRDIRSIWKRRLVQSRFKVEETANAAEAVRALRMLDTDVLVYGQASGSENGSFDLINEVLTSCPRTAVIFVATESSEELAIRAIRAGVADYIRAPLALEELVASVTRTLAELQRPAKSCSNSRSLDVDSAQIEKALQRPLIGDSPPMREAKSRLLRAAAADCNVLITGETGTGKDLAAQLIHHASLRKGKPLLSINCAAIPETLLESELFGYERGAFTGAQWANAGLLERADGGTLFLDEVGEMSPVAQAKILRVIETKELSRLGGRETVRVNVRFIAATNQNIEALIKEHRFRQDLYFRLNILRIHLSPLRERKEDLPALLSHYMEAFNRQFGRTVERFSEMSYQRLLAYDWPGNIRELRNLLEAPFVNLPPEHMSCINLPPEFETSDSCSGALCERDQLMSALLSTKWNKSEAARRLHWSRMTVYRKIMKYDIREPYAPRDSSAPECGNP